MSDIWENVAVSLMADVKVMLSGLRDSAFFEGMGSEIERAFAAHLIGGAYISGFPMYQGMPLDGARNAHFLAPQVQSGAYRVDFVLGHASNFNKPHKCIVIECDGHAFHEKTKEQAARDKARDRFLSTEYGRVIRFSGSEIYRDVGRCVTEAVSVLMAADRAGE